jgi:3-phenylpropionate/trans-cinnamate dioxygenase ferredoxin reductase subunit
VGGGLAAQRCVETLRARGHDGPITLVCGEAQAPYDRPPLSKAVLAGEPASPFRPPDWYATHSVEVRLGTLARGLDAERREVVLADRARLPYGRLLIATGARPVMLPALAGCANAQVLRTLDDALRLRAALRPGARLVIVGAGLIGQEVAAAARAAGAHVTLLDAAHAPFDALVGAALGPWMASLQRDAGVRLRLGARLDSVVGDEWAEALVLAGGERIACDHVLIGIGVRPDTDWLAPHELGPAGRTRLPGVFAAGDAVSPGHWEAAARQGMAAARSMLGLPPVPPAPPLVWSDQHGVRIQRLGDPRGADSAELDGYLAARDFTVTYHRAGRPVAAVLVGRPGALPPVRRRLAAATEPERNAA